jgi:hypothetical protein
MLVLIFLAVCTLGSVRSFKQDNPADCAKVKTNCNRKNGCKCKFECTWDTHERVNDPNCRAYCCESKCDCHPGHKCDQPITEGMR